MIDIKFLRENPDIVRQNIKNKFQDFKLPMVDEVIELDEKLRKTKAEADELRSKRNKISKEIGALMAQGKKEEAEQVKASVASIGETLAGLEPLEAELEEKVKKRLKPFLINYGRENVSLGMTIDMKCLNIIDEKWFMVSVSISDVDKFLVGWYNESNEPEISVFDDLDTAQTVYDSIRNKLKQFGLIE